MSRAADDSGNIELPLTSRTVTVGNGTGSCPCSIWSNAQIPGRRPSPMAVPSRSARDSARTSTGSSRRSGSTRGPQNVGPHVGHLWTGGGTCSRRVTFSSETASGWQQATLSGRGGHREHDLRRLVPHRFWVLLGRRQLLRRDWRRQRSAARAARTASTVHNGVYRYGASAFPTDVQRRKLLGRRRLRDDGGARHDAAGQ